MVKVLGHRGARQLPQINENSLRAFGIGFTTADGIETDGTVSKNGTVFLSHEIAQKYIPHLVSRSFYVFKNFLDAASAAIVGKRRIEQLTDAEMDKLRLKKGAQVPRLTELFNLAAEPQNRGKTINIELKGEGSVEPVINAIHDAVAAGQITKDQIILSSFNHHAVLKAKELDPEIRRGLIFSGSARWDSRIFPWSNNKTSRYVRFNNKALKSKMVNNVAPDIFVLKAAVVTEKNINLLRGRFPGAKVMFWTSMEKPPSENSQAVKILSNPQLAPVIEAVITDYPEQMTKLLKAKGLKV